MTDSNVFQLSRPGTLCDPLTEVLRSGAEAHEDDAERAARAGLAVIDAVGRLATQEPLNVADGVKRVEADADRENDSYHRQANRSFPLFLLSND